MISLFLFFALQSGVLNAQTTYFISQTNGDDSNHGSITSPFRTIQAGADAAQPGDTVYVLEGVYRERVAPPRGGTSGSPIVYMAESDKEVYIKGSDVWSPNWNNVSGNVFSATPPDSIFNDDVYTESKNPFKVPVSSTPYGLNGKPEVDRGQSGDPNLVLSIGQVFVDGFLLTQKGYLSEVQSNVNSWHVDMTTGTITIHFPDSYPDQHVVEISTRRRIFAPHLRQLGYIEVHGFIMEHCGNQYPTNFWSEPKWQQAGALGTRSGHHWTIKNNIIRYAHGVGIDFGNEGNRYQDLEVGTNGEAINSGYHLIDSNYITNNGGGGTAAYFPKYVTFTNNVIQHNNNLYFDGYKRWESAGVKMHGPHYSTIANNLIRDNYAGWGLWLDQGSGNDTKVHGNLIIGHEIGFDLEIGTAYPEKLILDNNVLIDNEIGIGSRESGGIISLNNMIINSSDHGLENTVNSSRTGSWTSDYHYHFNNIFIGNNKHIAVEAPDHFKSSDRRFDYNVYDASPSQDKFDILHGTSTSNFSDWQNAWDSYNNGTDYDANATLTSDLSYSFDHSNFELTINAFFDISSLRIRQHDSLSTDYLGAIIPNDTMAIPGPFQNLVQGSNFIDLWGDLMYEIIDSQAQPVPVFPPLDNVLAVVDDAYARGGSYANTNFGSGDLQTKVDANGNPEYTREAFVRFDLTSLPANAETVKLRLTTTNSNVSNWTAYFVSDDSWSEDSLIWNNRPSYATSFGTISNSSSSTLEWDVSAQALSERVGDGILSIVIVGDQGFHGFLYSKETAPDSLSEPLLHYILGNPTGLIAIEDAYARGGSYANTNFGSDNLQTKIDANNNLEYTREAFVKFDLTDLPSNANSIKFRLITTNSSVSAWTAHLVTNDNWSEDSLTWNNRPTQSVISFGTQSNSSSDTLEWDVSSVALSEYAGDGVLSIIITGSSGNHDFIHSKESTQEDALKPHLFYTISEFQTTEIIANEDTYVRGGTYASNNFGSSDLQTKDNPGDDSYTREVYVKFDLSDVESNATEVKLVLNSTNQSTSSWTASLVNDDSWSESTLTWNNKPSDSTSFGSQSNASSNTLEWDVTDEALDQLTSGDSVLSVKIAGASGFHGFFYSRESTSNNSLKPRLLIEASSSARTTEQQVVTNIEEIKTVDLIYPNPSNGRFSLRLSDDKYTSWHIYDYSGRVIGNGRVLGKETEININGNSGLFIIQLTGSEGVIPFQRKIMIK